jgi:hypothetical protein
MAKSGLKWWVEQLRQCEYSEAKWATKPASDRRKLMLRFIAARQEYCGLKASEIRDATNYTSRTTTLEKRMERISADLQELEAK